MKTIKENWKQVFIVAAGIVAVIFMCIFGVQGAQNKAFALEEQVNTANSDIKVQEKKDESILFIILRIVSSNMISMRPKLLLLLLKVEGKQQVLKM